MVHVVARPFHPPNIHLMDLVDLGKDNLYSLGSSVAGGVVQ